MKAAVYEAFQAPIEVREVPDPAPKPHGVVIQVEANGICRSDWHGWMGHDSDVKLPHVPGHELAGTIAELGSDVSGGWRVGDRVTVPFSCGCGTCPQCTSGNQQICDNYFQPGFTGWGSFAQYVAIDHADVNLVSLPDSVGFVEAASLGCRFITSFRAVVHVGRVKAGEWVVVYGCGGVGLSAVMIASAIGARVIAVDINGDALALATACGAAYTINAKHMPAVESVLDLTNGGAHVAIDALGSTETCRSALMSLRKRGRHVQVGLMLADDAAPPLPMGLVIAKELEILGSHGMQAHEYPPMLEMITADVLRPAQLIQRTVTLGEGVEILQQMGNFGFAGVTVIDRFSD